MTPFTYVGNRAHVVFGAGSLTHLAREATALGIRRALVLTTPDQQAFGARAQAALGELAGGILSVAAMHTPTHVTEAALAKLGQLGCDGLVAIGGGSAIGLSKALALQTDLQQIAVPTTYAGSEMTPILGETRNGHKITLRSPKVLPETVIYDAELTYTLPARLSAASGLNAMAHAVEALYAQTANPIISQLAEEGIAALARSLPQIGASPADPAIRSDALYGAWLCGVCLGSVGMALHHKLCHVLAGAFNLPHAETHAAVLPHAAAYNASAAPEAMARVARALGVKDAPAGLYDLAGSLQTPRALRELGMPESGIDHATDLVLKDVYWNPRPFERGAISAMIERAWRGEKPA